MTFLSDMRLVWLRCGAAGASMATGLVMCMAAAAQPQSRSLAYELPPSQPPAELLPAHLLRSGNHRVRADVETVDNFFHFELESDYGLYRPKSLAMLKIRVKEVVTLAQAINQYNKTDQRVADELRGQLRVRGDSWTDILGAPVGTASELASQFANNVGQTVVEINELSSGEPAPTAASPRGTVSTAHKRSIASQLNLDAYSTNPKVQQFLATAARARSGGNFSAGVVAVSVPRSRSLTVGEGVLDFKIKSRLKNLTPSELAEVNDRLLEGMGVRPELRRMFLEHVAYSPRHTTAIVAHLDFLAGVADRGVLIEAALRAKDEADALSYEETARMLAVYHESVDRLGALRSRGRFPLALTQAGRLLIVLPVDIVYWTEEADGMTRTVAADAVADGHADVELLLSGMLTDLAREQLQERSVGFRERFLNKD